MSLVYNFCLSAKAYTWSMRIALFPTSSKIERMENSLVLSMFFSQVNE